MGTKFLLKHEQLGLDIHLEGHLLNMFGWLRRQLRYGRHNARNE
ncbi:MAG: hypothetical protein ACREX4_25210 [Gammaproteobacteria bacterium]